MLKSIMPRSYPTIKTYQLARTMRHDLNEVEAKLWTYLRAHRFYNIHFRRQYAIGKYIVDFCAPRKKFVIELDGSQHMNHEEYDIERTNFLKSQGYHVIRFWNHDIMNNFEDVCNAIKYALDDQESKK